jgi:trehalose/maltose hydrolase-like predicted phosphorylase
MIRGVIPPDENALGVQNSVYTNVIAKMSLNIAIELATVLGHTVPSQWANIAKYN